MQRKIGTLITWLPERFFGFIHLSEDGEVKSYYLHGTQVGSGLPTPGATVEFTPGKNNKGGNIALNATVLISVAGGATALAGGK